MANNKKHSQTVRRLVERTLAARQLVPRHRAVAHIMVPVRVEPSGPMIKDLLGSFAEQTGANFG
jgi:hypothetical protein